MPRPHSTKPRSEFAQRLIQVRESFGVRTGRPDLDQKQFAAILIIGDEAYRRYERGETEPKLSTLAKLRHLTGVPLDWLIAGIEERPSSSKPLTLLRKSGHHR
jgi:transcriptional regulator with XRE-family HTH domain